jgi:hypothetical protein
LITLAGNLRKTQAKLGLTKHMFAILNQHLTVLLAFCAMLMGGCSQASIAQNGQNYLVLLCPNFP